MKTLMKWLFSVWLSAALFTAAFTGVAYQDNTSPQPLSIIIVRPGEGETIYDGPQTMLYSIFVTGVVHLGSTDPTQSELKLEIFSKDMRIGSYTGHPDTHGNFSVAVTVNPDKDSKELTGGLILDPNAGCQSACHFAAELDLVPGPVLIRATITTPDGQQAYSERHVIVDRSGYASIPVHVELMQGRSTSLTGIPVTGGARLYLWRARYTTALTDSEGYATLKAEALAEAPTHYILRVEPSVVDGVLYESTDSVEITLPPGAMTSPLVTLHVTGQRGQITGQVSNPPGKLPLWAIHLPDGLTHKTMATPQGAFSFTNLPIDQYIISTDLQSLAVQGLTLMSQKVDLTHSPKADLTLSTEPLEGQTINGSVTDADGIPLPFAWVSFENSKRTQAVLPDSGSFDIFGLSKGTYTAIVSAPGYFCQARLIQAGTDESITISLNPRPETQRLPWGPGEVILPPETAASLDGQRIRFESGWIWSQGGSENPLTIEAGSVEITIPAGSFALEKVPGEKTWFYLFDGRATIHREGDANLIHLGKNQVIILSENAQLAAVPYDPVVVAALHPEGKSPISFTWQPTLQAQIRDRLARIGISATQLITFITYIMVVLSVVLAPLAGIYWIVMQKVRRKNSHHLT